MSYIEEGGEIKYEPKPSLINFTVAGTVYQAEEGMTWGEFINSSYNQNIFTILGGYVKCIKNGHWVVKPGTAQIAIEGNEQIIKDQNYTTGSFPV